MRPLRGVGSENIAQGPLSEQMVNWLLWSRGSCRI